MDILNDLIYQKGEAFVASGCMYVTNCILCNEEVPVSLHDNSVKVCERCKQAWSKMRNIIENSPKYATGAHITHVGRETIAKTPKYTEDKK